MSPPGSISARVRISTVYPVEHVSAWDHASSRKCISGGERISVRNASPPGGACLRWERVSTRSVSLPGACLHWERLSAGGCVSAGERVCVGGPVPTGERISTGECISAGSTSPLGRASPLKGACLRQGAHLRREVQLHQTFCLQPSVAFEICFDIFKAVFYVDNSECHYLRMYKTWLLQGNYVQCTCTLLKIIYIGAKCFPFQ